MLASKLETFYNMSLIILFCLMAVSSNAVPLLRSPRQTMDGDLAMGVTNARTSYNPYYDGQASFGNPPDQQTPLYQGSYAVPTNKLGNRYDRIAPGGFRRGVINGYNGYDGSGYNLAGTATGYGQSWRGFGAGKRPVGIRPNPQYGVKY